MHVRTISATHSHCDCVLPLLQANEQASSPSASAFSTPAAYSQPSSAPEKLSLYRARQEEREQEAEKRIDETETEEKLAPIPLSVRPGRQRRRKEDEREKKNENNAVKEGESGRAIEKGKTQETEELNEPVASSGRPTRRKQRRAGESQQEDTDKEIEVESSIKPAYHFVSISCFPFFNGCPHSL